MDPELRQLLKDVLEGQAELRRAFDERFRSLKEPFEFVHRRLSSIEGGQEAIARDALNTRDGVGKLRVEVERLSTVVGAVREALIPLLAAAEGRNRSTDTFRAVRAKLETINDG